MDHFWWNLPGPNKFILNIVNDLHEGKNVIMCLPEHFPEGLYNAIKNNIQLDNKYWQKLDTNDWNDISPEECLYKHFVNNYNPYKLINPNSLSNEESFSDYYVWLNGVKVESWDVWKKFIVEYSHVIKSKPKTGRSVFCIPITGDIVNNLPEEDVCLAIYFWKGVVDLLDMQIFVSYLLSESKYNVNNKNILISVISRIALWDPILSEILTNENFQTVLNPYEILKKIGLERKWSYDNLYSNDNLWVKGMQNYIGDKDQLHSAVLVFNDKNNEIKRRIWSGEVSVILPFIEEKRLEIINEIGKILKLPFKDKYNNIIDNIFDLEIGHIMDLIVKNKFYIDKNLFQLICRLREIRNSLSHIEIPDPELLNFDNMN